MSNSYTNCKKGGYMKCKKDDCIKQKKDKSKLKCPKKVEEELRLTCFTRGRTFDLLGRTGETLELASVNVDLKGLISAIIKLDFSTTIEYAGQTDNLDNIEELDLDLEFILTRTCEDGIEQELERYSFVRDFDIGEFLGTITLISRTTDPISFTFCDSINACKVGCCIYKMKVLVSNVEENTVITANIGPSFMNAVTQGAKKC